MVLGSPPKLSSTGALVLLNASWAFTVYVLGRRGWRVFHWTHWSVQIGWSLLIAQHAFPHSPFALSRLEGLAVAAVLAGTLPQFLQMTRKPVAQAEKSGAGV